jgi:hypothetical protein
MSKHSYQWLTHHMPKRRKPSTAPKHKGRSVVLKDPVTGVSRVLPSGRYASQMARVKGGNVVQATGACTTRFTSETGRKAAQRLWKTRFRKHRGLRLGVPAHRRPTVGRAALRARYADGWTAGVRYDAVTKTWMLGAYGVVRPITERTALARLGHLPRVRKTWVPDGMILVKTVERKARGAQS